MVRTSRRTLNSSDCKSGGRTVGGTEPGSGGYGLYAGKGWSNCAVPCARASVNPARGTLRIPSTVARAAFTSVDLSRRIGVPPSALNAEHTAGLAMVVPVDGEPDYRF